MLSNRSLLGIALMGAALVAVVYYLGMRHDSAPAAPAGPAASAPASPAPSEAMSDRAPGDQTADAEQQQETETPKLPADGEWFDGAPEKSDPKPEQNN
jgi:hypothetical protein